MQIFAATVLMLTTSVANAAIMQDIILENVIADPGNEFGISDGFSGVVGTISYNPENVDAFGNITYESDEDFFFEITLGSVTLNLFDDEDFPFFPLAHLVNPDQKFSGVSALDAYLTDGDNLFEIFADASFGFSFFAAEDMFGNLVEGDIRFGTAVPEPSMAALFLAAFVLLRTRKQRS